MAQSPSAPALEVLDSEVIEFISCDGCGQPNIQNYVRLHCNDCGGHELNGYDICPQCSTRVQDIHPPYHEMYWIQPGSSVAPPTQEQLRRWQIIKDRESHIKLRPPGEAPFWCDRCYRRNFSGPRYKCKDCLSPPGVDLCENCTSIAPQFHTSTHRFQVVSFRPDPAAMQSFSSQGTLSTTSPSHVWMEVRCDNCQREAFSGSRYRCTNPSCDFDLCSSCISSAQEIHPGHAFASIAPPGSSDWLAGSSIPSYNSNGYWSCDSCRAERLSGVRYTCTACPQSPGYDLCEKCIMMVTLVHPQHYQRMAANASCNSNGSLMVNGYQPSFQQQQQAMYIPYK